MVIDRFTTKSWIYYSTVCEYLFEIENVYKWIRRAYAQSTVYTLHYDKIIAFTKSFLLKTLTC